MDSVNIEDIDLKNSFFHSTLKDNLNLIEEYGLVARVGDTSKSVGDSPRVYLSKGGREILEIKNSFISKFKDLRVCDIPKGYQKYFPISDFSSTEFLKAEMIYDAMEKRFRDEIYLKVNAKEGEDFVLKETFKLGSEFDIEVKANHNISVDKLLILTSPKGDSTMDIVQYLYNKLLEKHPGKENVIREMYSDLAEMLDYIRDKNKISIKSVISKAIKDGVNLEDLSYVAITSEKNRNGNVKGFTKNE